MTDGDSCLIFHDEPDNKDLYYLGWCHGPVGTARLFYLLGEVSGDKTWLDWVRRSANGLMTSGIPEQETPGFWNNAGICCGLAGVGEFFLDLSKALGERSYLEFSKRVASHSRQGDRRERPDVLAPGRTPDPARISVRPNRLHAGGGRDRDLSPPVGRRRPNRREADRLSRHAVLALTCGRRRTFLVRQPFPGFPLKAARDIASALPGPGFMLSCPSRWTNPGVCEESSPWPEQTTSG